MQVKWTKSAQKRLDKAIGICYEGGLDEEGHPKDTRTLLQKAALVALVNKLREAFPAISVVGHNDLNLHKACPCFSVVSEFCEFVS